MNPAIPLPKGTTDPFADVLQKLQVTIKSFNPASGEPIAARIAKVERLCADVRNALGYANDLPPSLQGLGNTLTGLGGECEALTAIPVVGGPAKAAAPILRGTADSVAEIHRQVSSWVTSVGQPLERDLNALTKALHDALGVVTAISQTIPDYIRTVKVLSYCLDITQAVLPLLKGTEAQKTTQDFIDEMIRIRDALAAVLVPLADFATKLDQVVNEVDVALGSRVENIDRSLASVRTGLVSLKSVVDPIHNAINTIENAIAPVKWVLGKAKCVVKRVLQPILDPVLETTGLDCWIHKLTGLRVPDITSFVRAFPDGFATANAWIRNGGPASAMQDWNEVAKTLEKYNTRDKGNTYKLITNVVAALTGSEIGGDLPDWPCSAKSLPVISEVAKVVRPDLLPVENGQRQIYSHELRRHMMDLACEALAPAVRVQSTPTAAANGAGSVLWVTDVLINRNVIQCSYDKIGLPQVTRLLEAAAKAKTSVQDAERIGPALVTSLEAFEASQNLPRYFREEMGDFAQMFSDGREVMDFLASFEWMAGILKDISGAFQRQSDAAQGAIAEAKTLEQSALDLARSIERVEKREPSSGDFTVALQYIDQVAAGAAAVGNTMQAALDLDARLKGRFRLRIAALQTRTDALAAAAVGRMDEIQSTVTTAMAEADRIQACLATYASRFLELRRTAQPVSDTGLPGLAKGVQVCNTIAAILDPLSGILSETGCEKKNAVVAEAARQCRGLKALVDKQSPVLTDALDFLISERVPTESIRTSISSLSNDIDSDYSRTLAAATASLGEAFDRLKGATASAEGFRYTSDQSFQSTVLQLVDDMNLAAADAGIELPA